MMYTNHEKYFWDLLDSCSSLTKNASTELDIELTEKEKEIFELLMAVVRTKAPNTTLRVTGSWVNSKLENKKNQDMIISCDNMSGVKFAQLAFDWMQNHGISAQEKISITQSNDQKTEIATIVVLGSHIDFTRLTASPEVLCYNINDDKIENLSKDDIKPVKKEINYSDDPSRFLRAVKFFSKYDLEPDDHIKNMKSLKDKEDFCNRITKNHIFNEIIGQKEKDNWRKNNLIGHNFDKACKLLENLEMNNGSLKKILYQINKAYQKHTEE